MKHLIIVSWSLTILGILLGAVAILGGLDILWLLTGMLLAVAGIVKLAMLMIWTRLARLGTDEHAPIEAL